MSRSEARQDSIKLSARLGAVAELRDLFLKNLELRLDDSPPEPPYEAAITISPAVGELKSTSVSYELAYDITGNKDGIDFLVLHCVYVATFDLPEGMEVTEGEIGAFGSTTVPFALHPYIRELVHNVTSRTAIPPLTLGTMQLPAEVAEMLTKSIG